MLKWYVQNVQCTKVAKMSIQFRTRSQTPVDYSSFINGQGSSSLSGCCYYKDATNQIVKLDNTSIGSCNINSGYFIPGACDDNLEITVSSMGCCCACKNKQSGEYLKETTFCECQDSSGYWTLGSCPTGILDETTLTQYCVSRAPESLDYRQPRACCHPQITENGVEAVCEDVCTEKECAEKTVYPYDSTFYKNGRKCNENVGFGLPVSNECKLSLPVSGKVINSCVNGTNTYSWALKDFVNNTNKFFYDSIFAGKYAKAIEGNVFYTNENALVLGPAISKETPLSNNAATSLYSKEIKKISSGGYSLIWQTNPNELPQNDAIFDGYFAILDNEGTVNYISSPHFKNQFNPLFSPIPSTEITEKAIDLIAARTFSAFINENNTLRIFGKFYDSTGNQYKQLVVSDKLKKIYRHNQEQTAISVGLQLLNMGFIGQKMNGSFEYYSPFIDDYPQLQQLRTMVRSIPNKNYVTASFGAYTFCGIDEANIMTCNSLNSELNFPISTKYKLVSCQTVSNLQPDPNQDFCYAVTEDNRIIRISSSDDAFDITTEPILSTTNVLSLSCIYGFCDMVVEVDETICNSQTIGSCCTCDDQGNPKPCETTTRGNCAGNFTSDRVCCNDNSITGCVSCSEIQNQCADSNSSNYFRSIVVEDDLPSEDLTYHKDGLYVGIFEPGVPINSNGSTLRGNPTTGKASTYTSEIVGYGTTTKRWGIVVAPFDYSLGTINDNSEFIETIPASLYDGLWNTYGDSDTYYGIQSKTMESLRVNSRLSGWYLPSKNELEFINYKMNHGFFIPELFQQFNSGLYLTSTPYFEQQSNTVFNISKQEFGGKSFMYAQSFEKSKYGNTYLVGRTSSINVRLIRRIELE